MNPSLPPHQVLERVVRTCPLALRFRDEATGTLIGDDLNVEAYPEGLPARRVTAQPNRRGIYVFTHLPGLRAFEHSGRLDPWLDAPVGRRFAVEVWDRQARYLPCRLVLEAPRRGVFDGEPLASPLADARDSVPMFPSPTRSIPAGFGVLRAQLRQQDPPGPAAWAFAELRERERRRGRSVVARGVADQNGRLTVVVPYPAPGNFSLGSPPTGAPQLLSEQRWPFRLRVWGMFEAEPGEYLDLERALRLPERAPDLLSDAEARSAPVESVELVFGRELTVPERDPGDARPRELYLTGAGSPP